MSGDVLTTPTSPALVAGVRATRWGRLVESQTAVDFEGGVSWDVPAADFTIDDAQRVLEENGLSAEGARIQERQSDATDFIKVQVADQPEQVGTEMREQFAEAAGVDPDDVNVNLVSSSWGSEITEKAVRALVIFLALVAVFI